MENNKKYRNCNRLRNIRNRGFFMILLLLNPFITFLRAEKEEQTIFKLAGNATCTEIDFENHNNLIILPVIINGVYQTRFILDSGARGTVLLEKNIADLLGFSYSREITIAGAGSRGVLKAYEANEETIALKGVEAKTSDIYVLEDNYLNLPQYLGVNVQGIIGTALFKDFVIDIDYQNHKLKLHNPKHFTPPKSFTPLPLRLLNGKPYIRGSLCVSGQTYSNASLLVDIGASHAMLLTIRDSMFMVPEKHIETTLGRGISGELTGYIGRVESLSIGNMVFTDVLTSFSPEYSKIQMPGRAGTIGGELLSRFHIIVSFFDSAMYVKPVRKYNKPFEYNMSGLDIMAFGAGYDRFLIDGVLENSPAEKAGLLPGDEIIKINFINAKDFSLSHINAIFRSRENKKIRLKIKRDSIKKIVKFRLQKLI
jgi:hypothetical protein